jgi:predicted Zn-dependent peptidase
LIVQEKLENGTHVLMETVPHTRTVSIGFWFLHGSRDELPNELGMSHFIEHMMFKGTKKRSAFTIVQAIDRVGGVLNAFTEKEQTCFYCTLASVHLELAVDVLSDMVFQSLFPNEEIEREKIVISNEISESEDVAEENAYELFLRNMWGNHPLANRITGEIDCVERITGKTLSAFYSKWFTTNNMIISVAGDIRPERVKVLLNQYLPSGGHTINEKNNIHPPYANSWDYISARFHQVQIIAGTSFELPAAVDEFYHFLVFSTVFGESMSSRLFQNLREQAGLCYSVSAMRTFFSSTALWIIYANTSPKLMNKLLLALNDEFHRLKTDPPTKEEIEDAKTHLSGGLILSLEDMEVRMKRMVRHFLLGGEVHSAEVSIEALNLVEQKHVQHVIDKIVHADKFNLLAYGTRNLHKRKKIFFDF